MKRSRGWKSPYEAALPMTSWDSPSVLLSATGVSGATVDDSRRTLLKGQAERGRGRREGKGLEGKEREIIYCLVGLHD